jgi:hypothetical protein
LALAYIAHLAFKTAATPRAFFFFMFTHLPIGFEKAKNICVAGGQALRTGQDETMQRAIQCHLLMWKQKAG